MLLGIVIKLDMCDCSVFLMTSGDPLVSLLLLSGGTDPFDLLSEVPRGISFGEGLECTELAPECLVKKL